MSKTGWTFKQAKNAKESGELMCASLRRVRNYWQIELHEWDGFKGPIEGSNEKPIRFETADLAIRGITEIGFECNYLLYPSKPNANSYVGTGEEVRFVVTSNGRVRPAVEKTSLQVL